MVPLRNIFEELDAYIMWDSNMRTIVSIKNDRSIMLQTDNIESKVNGEIRLMDVPPVIVSGYTMVPLLFISESMCASVEWEEETRTVFITS
jgi:hypothetical protein